MNGKVLDHFKFERMKLHDVVVTADGQRLLGVATLLASADDLRPSLARAEKQIIGAAIPVFLNFNSLVAQFII